MNGNKEQYVKVTPPNASVNHIPAWVDDAGQIHFKKMISGRKAGADAVRRS
jgi:hypothetical protein